MTGENCSYIAQHAMGSHYPKKILTQKWMLIFGFWVFVCGTNVLVALETFETILYKDEFNIEHEEYAFRAPIKGIPSHILDLHCANTKLRLYWSVYRTEIEENHRKGLFLRRISRLTRHIFAEVRLADKPFNATQLSVIDHYFGVKDNENAKDGKESDDDEDYELAKVSADSKGEFEQKKRWYHKYTRHFKGSKTNELIKESSSKGPKSHLEQLKNFIRKYAPKVGMTVYTRWRTMWWLMMPCLFAKYYLWDPALDEFNKLQRSLVMYPDFLSLRLQDTDCAPIKLFQHILDACKLLNPLLNFNFGQLSLDKTIAPGSII